MPSVKFRKVVTFKKILFFTFFLILTYCTIKHYGRCVWNPYYFSLSQASTVVRNCRPWFHWSNYYRKCLSTYLEARGKNRTAWRHIHEAISTCSGQSAFDMMNINYLHNKDDYKLIILPSDQLLHSPCTEVTLGIGNDTASEEKLLNFLPKCRMHGADPLKNVGETFQRIGKYYEMAVAGKNGVFNASVLVGPGIWDYAVKEVPTVAFVDFLKSHVKSPHVDYLFMDNEGGEYEILPLLNRGSSANDVTICQMSVELHGPLQNYGMDNVKYNDVMFNIIKLSPFIPFWSAAPARHARMFLLNAENEYCVEKYLYQWCVTS